MGESPDGSRCRLHPAAVLIRLAELWKTTDPTAALNALQSVLDLLVEPEHAGPFQVTDHLLDHLLAVAREYAGHAGIGIIPEQWSFADPVRIHAPHVIEKPVFRNAPAAGRIVRIKRFGLAAGDLMVREAELIISAGPPPPGLTDLEDAAERIPDPAGESLRERFAGLRSASLEGFLELALTDLYTHFWDRVFPDWRVGDSEAARAFGGGLGAMVCESLGLTVYTPQHVSERPEGWVMIPPGTRISTGRVERVLRPGLHRDGVLHVPARATVE